MFVETKSLIAAKTLIILLIAAITALIIKEDSTPSDQYPQFGRR